MSDYLKHYGVLGMKWGVRSNYGNGSYSYKSRRTAKLERKAQRHAIDTPKHEKYSRQAARSKKLDASKEKYYNKTINKKSYSKKASAAILGEHATGIATSMAATKLIGIGASTVSGVLGLLGSVSIHDAYQVHRSFGDKAVVAAVKSVGGFGLVGSTIREHDYIYGKKEKKTKNRSKSNV